MKDININQELFNKDASFIDIEHRQVISFKGEYSDECEKFLHRLHGKFGLRLSLLVIIPMVIVCVIMLVCKAHWYWALLCLVLGIFVGGSFGLIVAKSNNFAEQIDIENGVIYITNEKGGLNISQGIDNVESVTDYGSFYHIKFFGNRFPFGVCQKDLLASGTIEEFEQVFVNLLVKQNICN